MPPFSKRPHDEDEDIEENTEGGRKRPQVSI